LGAPRKQAQGQAEIPSQGSGDSLFLMPNEPVIEVTLKQTSKQIVSLISIVTPLQFTKGNLDVRWIFNEELTLIFVEKMPPNEFFFE
jgi:hypothetical protein